MQQALTLILLAAAPLTAHARPKRGSTKCEERALVTVTETVVVAPTTVIVQPTEDAVETETETEANTDNFYPATTMPTTFVVSSVPPPSSTSSRAQTKETSPPSETSEEEEPAPEPTSGNSSGGRSDSGSGSAPKVPAPNPAPLADATEVADSPASTEMCGNRDRKIMPGKPWTVSNAMYNAGSMEGRQCTNYETLLETADGVQHVKYRSVTDIRRVDDTEDVCKGYSNVGIGTNLRKRFRDVSSIPAYFQWDRQNTSGFKGKPLPPIPFSSPVLDFLLPPATS